MRSDLYLVHQKHGRWRVQRYRRVAGSVQLAGSVHGSWADVRAIVTDREQENRDHDRDRNEAG